MSESQGRSATKSAALTWWVLFDYAIPVLCIAAFWPIAEYLHEMPHAFARTFYGADLLPLSSVLILGVVRELEVKSRLGLIDMKYENARHAALFFSIALLIAYTAIKFFTMKYQIPDDAKIEVKPVVQSIARISWYAVLATGAFCFWLKTLAREET